MKPLYIYFVRHGKTEFNLKGLVQGWNDSPLSELGVNQARFTGNGLKGITFSKAYSGPASRQYNTGKIVLKESENNDIEIEKCDFFKEMGYGDFQGGTVEAMMNVASDKLGVKVKKYYNAENLVTPYDISKALGNSNYHAETVDDSSARLMRGIEKVIDENQDGGNILIATSACAIDISIRTLFPEILHYRLPENCSVSIVKYADGIFSLEKFSDISYREKGEKVLI